MKATDRKGFIEQFHNKDSIAIFLLIQECHASLLKLASEIVNDAAVGEYLLVRTYLKLILLRKNFKTTQDIDAFLHNTLKESCYAYLKHPRDLVPEKIAKSLPEIVIPIAIFEEINQWDAESGAIADIIVFQKLNTNSTMSYIQLLDMPEFLLRQKLIELRLFRLILKDQFESEWVL